jgi:hypothetical protein
MPEKIMLLIRHIGLIQQFNVGTFDVDHIGEEVHNNIDG